jgi:hypothetical protein
MGIRQTSILAYRYLKDKGELGERQLEVLKAFEQFGNATDKEIAYYMCKPDPNYIRPRRNDIL